MYSTHYLFMSTRYIIVNLVMWDVNHALSLFSLIKQRYDVYLTPAVFNYCLLLVLLLFIEWSFVNAIQCQHIYGNIDLYKLYKRTLLLPYRGQQQTAAHAFSLQMQKQTMKHFINIQSCQSFPRLPNMITYFRIKLLSHQHCCQVNSIDESQRGRETLFSSPAAPGLPWAAVLIPYRFLTPAKAAAQKSQRWYC